MEDWMCTKSNKKIQGAVEWHEESKINIPDWCLIKVPEKLTIINWLKEAMNQDEKTNIDLDITNLINKLIEDPKAANDVALYIWGPK